MKTARFILCIVVLNFIAIISNAQIAHHPLDLPKLSYAQDFKDRQLIVIVSPPDQSIIDKYNKKGKSDMADLYKSVYDTYNENMKAAVTKFWTFSSKEVLFMTWQDMEKLTKDKSQRSKYYLMFFFSRDDHTKIDWKLNGNGTKIEGTETTFAVCYPGDEPNLELHFSIPQLVPTGVDIMYLVSTLNYDLNYVLKNSSKANKTDMVLANLHMIANKTLLIPKERLGPDIINDIGKYYTCNYKIVDYDEMMEHIVKGDSTCTFLTISGLARRMNWIVNCADGATLAYSEASTDNEVLNSLQMYHKNLFMDLSLDCHPNMKK